MYIAKHLQYYKRRVCETFILNIDEERKRFFFVLLLQPTFKNLSLTSCVVTVSEILFLNLKIRNFPINLTTNYSYSCVHFMCDVHINTLVFCKIL